MMRCINCNGRTRVVDTVTDADDTNVYRRRKCEICGIAFYTKETSAINNQEYYECVRAFVDRKKRYKEGGE